MRFAYTQPISTFLPDVGYTSFPVLAYKSTQTYDSVCAPSLGIPTISVTKSAFSFSSQADADQQALSAAMVLAIAQREQSPCGPGVLPAADVVEPGPAPGPEFLFSIELVTQTDEVIGPGAVNTILVEDFSLSDQTSYSLEDFHDTSFCPIGGTGSDLHREIEIICTSGSGTVFFEETIDLFAEITNAVGFSNSVIQLTIKNQDNEILYEEFTVRDTEGRNDLIKPTSFPISEGESITIFIVMGVLSLGNADSLSNTQFGLSVS